MLHELFGLVGSELGHCGLVAFDAVDQHVTVVVPFDQETLVLEF